MLWKPTPNEALIEAVEQAERMNEVLVIYRSREGVGCICTEGMTAESAVILMDRLKFELLGKRAKA